MTDETSGDGSNTSDGTEPSDDGTGTAPDGGEHGTGPDRVDAGEFPTVQLSVPEMDCPSCTGKVDTRLARVAGVVETRLQPTTGTARVTYDSDRTGEGEIVAAIESAGYEVLDDGTDEADGLDMAPPTAVWTSPRALKTWVGAALLVVGLAVEFLAGWNPAVASVLGVSLTVADLSLVAATVASGAPVVRGGYYSARARSLDIDLLMGTAIVAATGIGYFVEAATLAVLFSIAELLEDYAMDRTRDSLRELLELSPDEATVRRGGEEAVVPADDVAVGETVVVRPGERVPLDGVVVEGESAVDESPITGESLPVDKSAGDEVYAGSITEDGYVAAEVTSTAGESTLARIIELVRDASENKTDTEQFVDRFAGYYTPVVVVLAVLTAAVPPLALGLSPGTWFVRGLTLLVIACPCAFVISTPVSVVSGITSAAKNGVLIKGGTHLETMGRVDAIALDKTGTLTKGELTVTDLVALGGADERDLLTAAAALERRSEHPIAEAVLARAEADGVSDRPDVSNFETLTGKGVRADLEAETYYAGKPALFEDLGFDLSARRVTDGGTVTGEGSTGDDGSTDEDPTGDATPADLAALLAAFESEGKTVVLVGTSTELMGVVAIADEVRPTSRRAVERLHELGVGHVAMLTGDNEGTARAVAETVGVDDYRAGLLPGGKVDAVERLQAEYGEVAMVGDGINDAPALAAADVAVAMGAAGTDTAIETADIALMGDDVSKLPYLYALSNAANNVIAQNIWASLGVKALLAVGVPLGYVSVALAVVVGDMGMSLGVTGNAMRLSRLEPESFED